MRTRPAGSPAFEGGAVIAAYGMMQTLPAATRMISSTDARRSTDAAIFACVSAKSLIQKATDARTQLTQKIGTESLRPLQEREGDISPERTLDDPDRKTRLRPQQAVPNGSCGRSNPLIPKASTATDGTDRKKGGRFTFWAGERRAPPTRACSGVHPDAPGFLIRCFGLPDPMTRIPCSGASISLIIFPVPRCRTAARALFHHAFAALMAGSAPLEAE